LPRPHLLAICFALWTTYAVLARKPVALFFICIAYTLCYTAPHLAIGIACVHAVVIRSWRLPLAATLGVLVGALLHPHFPNNFVMWWLQNVAVIQQAWGGGVPELRLGGEFLPASTREFAGEQVVLVAGVVLAALGVRRYADKLNADHATLFLLTVVFTLATAMSRRFNEYLGPFALWFLAEILWLWWQSMPR